MAVPHTISLLSPYNYVSSRLMKILRKLLALAIPAFFSLSSHAQLDSTLKFSGYMEAYYLHDFSDPDYTDRQPFLTNYNNQQQFDINVAVIRADYQKGRLKSRLALQLGSFPNNNYQEEPQLSLLQEAWIAYNLDSNAKWELRAGIMPSNLGLESVNPFENISLTRSLYAELSPYYLTGAMLSYKPNEPWRFAILGSNGWGNITRIHSPSIDFSSLGFGTQVQYERKNFNLNWGTYVGKNYSRFGYTQRIFNSLGLNWQVAPKLLVQLEYDLGLQKQRAPSKAYDFWTGSSLQIQYSLAKKIRIAARAEHFDDINGLLGPIYAQLNPPVYTYGLQTFAYSLNFDYQPMDQFLFRLEPRVFLAPEEVYFNGEQRMFQIAASVAARF